MNSPLLSFDQYRRKIRRELFLNRQQDGDNSEARLFYDAQKLDAKLISAGYQLIYSTEWCNHFDENRYLLRLKNASASHFKRSQTHLNFELMAEQR
jgi:hypothetical protein